MIDPRTKVAGGVKQTNSSSPSGTAGAPGSPGASGTGSGVPGPAGDDGEDGERGPPGQSGTAGVQGLQGPPGDDGQDGEAGPIGNTGAAGATGASGANGQDGEQGEEGWAIGVATNTVVDELPAVWRQIDTGQSITPNETMNVPDDTFTVPAGTSVEVQAGGILRVGRSFNLMELFACQDPGSNVDVPSSMVARPSSPLTVLAGNTYTVDQGGRCVVGEQGIGDPVFSAIMTTALQSINASVITKAGLNYALYDTHGYFSSSNNRYAPLIGGMYLFVWQSLIQSIADQKRFFTLLYKNGVRVRDGQENSMSTASPTNIGSQGAALLWMDGVTDYVELYVYHEDTGALNIAGSTIAREHTYLSGNRIST